ncbi:hypothetical protein Q5752_003216 [Cryptotrichosporon argae]
MLAARATVPAQSTTRVQLATVLPPTIRKLLDSRLYRLAVFHATSSDEWAHDAAVQSGLAEKLERAGAHKLAARLRRGIEVAQKLAADAEAAGAGEGAGAEPGRIRLMRAPAPGSPAHRQPARVPTLSAAEAAGLTEVERHTLGINAHLTYLLTPQALRSPLGIGELLRRINRHVAHRGFRPDRVTANIVVRCWLRSKGAKLGRKELRRVFELVRASMDVAPSRATLDVARPAVGADDSGLGGAPTADRARADAQVIRYEAHVRPFGRVMARAMRAAGDDKSTKDVRAWMAAWKMRAGKPGLEDET